MIDKGLELLGVGLEQKSFSRVKLPEIQIKGPAGKIAVQRMMAEMLGRKLLAEHLGNHLVAVGVEFFGNSLFGLPQRSQEQKEQEKDGCEEP
jgi:hypothetical protein